MRLFLFYKAHNKSKLIPLKQSLNITTTTNIVTFQEFIMLLNLPYLISYIWTSNFLLFDFILENLFLLFWEI